MTTSDKDFFDVDLIKRGNNKIAVLCHGLEGSSKSQYILGTASLLQDHGFDIAAMNYRGCSGEINRQVQTYHSGATADLHLLTQALALSYHEIMLVGYSLGGNLVLKYSCDLHYSIDEKIKRIVAISVPIDLHGASIQLLKRSNRLYTMNFLKTLVAKIKLKYNQHPHAINLNHLKKIRTVLDFDEYYTSKLNGFENAADYYARCNSKQYLHLCQRPTLIINAQDDPFLSTSCYPVKEAKSLKQLHLLMPKHGGHVGFVDKKTSHYWNEHQILSFLQESD